MHRPVTCPPTRPASLSRSCTLQRGLGKLQVLTILAVLAILAIVALPRLIKAVNHVHNPEVVTAEQDLNAFEKGLAQYRQDNGRYPSNEQGLLALIIKPTRAPVPQNWQTGGYLDRLPRDPWGNAYQYRVAEDGNSVDVFSFGAHGPDAGEDSADIVRSRH